MSYKKKIWFKDSKDWDAVLYQLTNNSSEGFSIIYKDTIAVTNYQLELLNKYKIIYGYG